MAKPKRKKMTAGEKICRWIETVCFVPDGKDVGKPMKLRSWQRDVILEIYDRPTRRAIISVGRKNAKTTLAAMLLLVHLCGPKARPNSELYSSALSRDQAAIIYRLAAKIVRLSPPLRAYVTCRDTVKQLYCEGLGTLYQALSAEAATNFGLSPVFLVHDELGQVKGPRHQLYEALETATGAQEAPLSVIISTQAPTDNDLLSILIDDARLGHDPETKLFIYEAPLDAEPFCEATIKLANPAFGDFQNAKEVLAMADAAKRMPAREAEYRNLILNQRVEAMNPFITQSVWQLSQAQPDRSSRLPWFGGLDLAETNDLTAFVLVQPRRTESWPVLCWFWLPEEGLADRARQERVPYDLWHKQGFLELVPGKAVSYEWVAQRIMQIMEELGVEKVAFDRWNMRHLRPWLMQAGLGQGVIDQKFQDFGQGFASMSPALRTIEERLLDGGFAHGGNPVLTMCVANAVARTDPAGNRKLDKSKSRGRIDGLVAMAMATQVATESRNQTPLYPVDETMLVENIMG